MTLAKCLKAMGSAKYQMMEIPVHRAWIAVTVHARRSATNREALVQRQTTAGGEHSDRIHSCGNVVRRFRVNLRTIAKSRPLP
jgi:hypothetical protein